MATTVDIQVPNQGVQASDWKEIFLGNDGNPKLFVHSTEPVAIANNLIVIALTLATIVAIMYLIMASWTLVTSGGDAEKYGKAKTGILNSVIGIVIIVSMWALIAAIRALARGMIG
jgi:hypothetical protein